MIKKLLGSVREYKRDSILAPVSIVVEVGLEAYIPFLMARLIDRGIEAGSMSAILEVGGTLVLICLVALILGIVAGHMAASGAAGFAKNLRKDMYYAIQNFSFSNMDRFSTASLITRLTTDVTNVQNAYQMLLRIAVRSPVMMLFCLFMAMRINLRISMIFLAAIPILALGMYVIITNAHPLFGRVFKTYDHLNRIVQENLRGIRVVKSYVREAHETEKFNEVSQVIYADFTKAEKIASYSMPLMQFAMYGCMLGASWLGARFIVGGTLTTGELMSVITYAIQILVSLMMLSMTLVMITISKASAERIVEVLEEKSDITDPSAPLLHVGDGSVEFENVSFRYAKDAQAMCLCGIDLFIPAGATVGILGGTGAGKTTLVQLIPRLYDVTEGVIKVGGADVRDYEIETLRRTVGMVLQKNVLFSGTIRENLRWGDPDATDAEIEHACRLAQADAFIRAFPDGYDTHIEQGGTNVSGGQRQRLCIARALVKKPKILILDDSTSAVDTATDAAIRQAFMEKIPDTTKIIIAQRVASVQDADIIIVMENGRIDGMGTHQELLQSNTVYREVYYSQTKGGDFDE